MTEQCFCRILAVLVLIFGLSATGQITAPSMGDDDVVKMVKARLSEEVMLGAVRGSACDFDLSVDALIELRHDGVSDGLLAAMQDCQRKTDAAASQLQPTSASAGIPATSGLRGVSVARRMITLSELKSGYPALWYNEAEGAAVTSEYRWRFGHQETVITDVPDNTPASKAGLRPGDLVVDVAIPGETRWGVASAADFYHLASRCIPDCLIGLFHPGGSLNHPGQESVGGHVVVGPSADFKLITDRFGCSHYEDNKYSPGKTFYDADMGPEQYRHCLASMEASNKQNEKLLQSLRPAQQQNSPETSPPNSVSQLPAALFGDPIRQEIDRIRNSPHGAMPPAQAIPSAMGGQTSMKVENATSCTLSVFVSGPASQSMQLAPAGSQSLSLAPGNYELAASVSCPNVIPFYGTQTLAANTQYSENFYIGVK